MTAWTAEREAKLKELWADGQTCAQIARVLGGGISRCAVIGKIHRLKLVLHRSPRPERTGQPRARVPQPMKVPVDLPDSGVYVEPLTLADGSPITLENVGNRMCRYIFGEPSFGEYRLCGHTTADGHIAHIIFRSFTTKRLENNFVAHGRYRRRQSDRACPSP